MAASVEWFWRYPCWLVPHSLGSHNRGSCTHHLYYKTLQYLTCKNVSHIILLRLMRKKGTGPIRGLAAVDENKDLLYWRLSTFHLSDETKITILPKASTAAIFHSGSWDYLCLFPFSVKSTFDIGSYLLPELLPFSSQRYSLNSNATSGIFIESDYQWTIRNDRRIATKIPTGSLLCCLAASLSVGLGGSAGMSHSEGIAQIQSLPWDHRILTKIRTQPLVFVKPFLASRRWHKCDGAGSSGGCLFLDTPGTPW